MEITKQSKIMGTKEEIEGCIDEDKFVIRDGENNEESKKYGAELSPQGHNMAFAEKYSRANGGKVVELL